MMDYVLSFLNLSSLWQLVFLLLAIVVLYIPIVIFSRTKDISLIKSSMVYFLVLYIAFVYYKTVISREALDESINYLFRPFWSYRLPMKYIRNEIIREITLNVLMLAPVGAILPFLIKKHRILITTLSAFLISLSIELLQLYTKTGFSEFDDVFHNTIGAFLTCIIFISAEKIIKSKNNRKKIK